MPSRLEPQTLQQESNEHYHSLLAAIRAADAAEVEQLLTKERPKGDHQHHTVLFKAAVKGGHPQVIRCLLRHGVVPLDESPLFIAIEKIRALEIVLAEGYSVHVTSTTGKTALQTAIALNPPALPKLLGAGCDVTARDRVQGNTALHTACIQNEESAILPLLQSGAWLNAVNVRGETPLHCLLRHACPPRDFHAKSRQSLARCLIHVGGHVTMTNPSHGRGSGGLGCRVGRPQYKVIQFYKQLLRETRHFVWPLQHLCRLKVRQLCELGGGRRVVVGTEEEEERCESECGRKDGGGNMADAVELLDVSCFLKDYLLFKQHVFDREAFSPGKAKTAGDGMGG